MNSKYFFCYSPTLHKYLNKKYKLSYICTAFHETNHKKFWLYEQSETLTKAINEYKSLFKGGDVHWLYWVSIITGTSLNYYVKQIIKWTGEWKF